MANLPNFNTANMNLIYIITGLVARDFDSLWTRGPMTPHQSEAYLGNITPRQCFEPLYLQMQLYFF